MGKAKTQIINGGLTPKQLKFVEHYCQSLNAADAARAAGYSSKNARIIGHQLLNIPLLRGEVDARLKTEFDWIRKKTRHSREDILDLFQAVAMYEIVELWTMGIDPQTIPIYTRLYCAEKLYYMMGYDKQTHHTIDWKAVARDREAILRKLRSKETATPEGA